MKFPVQRSLKYALRFGILSLGALAAMRVATHWLFKGIALNTALAFAGVALGFGVLGSRVFVKHGGRLALWSWLIFWPYFGLNFLSLWLFRVTSRGNSFDEIVPNLCLGCRLWPSDERAFPPIVAVLDLTAEFSEVGFLRRAPHYLCVPILDTTSPTREELSRGIEFIRDFLPQGPVFVHCALGHGRSATFVAAYLVASGQVESVATALNLVQKMRPDIELHPDQRALLDQYFSSHGHKT